MSIFLKIFVFLQTFCSTSTDEDKNEMIGYPLSVLVKKIPIFLNSTMMNKKFKNPRAGETHVQISMKFRTEFKTTKTFVQGEPMP